MPILLNLLKLVGLGGVGKRGGITLLVGAFLLLLPVALPALKAKIPFVGTEAKLTREVKRNAQLQTDLATCVSADQANKSTITALQDQSRANAERAEREKQNRDRLRADYEKAEQRRREHEAADERRLADAIRNTQDQCANTPIPADILACVLDSTASCHRI